MLKQVQHDTLIMAEDDKKFLGIKKETLWKVAGWSTVGLLTIGLLRALL